MKTSSPTSSASASASALIDQKIIQLGDWRGNTLAKVRDIIQQADPQVVEEWKWMGTPVWSHAGILCTGETYKSIVKLTFAKGAALDDPSGRFNSSLEGKVRRAIDIHEDEEINIQALENLIRAAVQHNLRSNTKAKAAANPELAAGASTPDPRSTLFKSAQRMKNPTMALKPM